MNLIGHAVIVYPEPRYQVADSDNYRSEMIMARGPGYRGHIVAWENGEYKIEYVIDLAVKTFSVVDPNDDAQCKLLTTGE